MNQIICDDCRNYIPTLPDNSIDAVVSDPPFGENMGYAGDKSINEAEGLLYDYLRLLEPKLKQSAHIVLFWTMRNLDVLIDAP